MHVSVHSLARSGLVSPPIWMTNSVNNIISFSCLNGPSINYGIFFIKRNKKLSAYSYKYVPAKINVAVSVMARNKLCTPSILDYSNS